MTKQYNVRAALVAWGCAHAAGASPDLKATLAAFSDIPADRLGFAVHEIGQALAGLRLLIDLIAMVEDDPEKRNERIAESIGEGTVWTDDDKGNLSVNVYAEEAEGDPLIAVRTKLKPEPTKD